MVNRVSESVWPLDVNLRFVYCALSSVVFACLRRSICLAAAFGNLQAIGFILTLPNTCRPRLLTRRRCRAQYGQRIRATRPWLWTCPSSIWTLCHSGFCVQCRRRQSCQPSIGGPGVWLVWLPCSGFDEVRLRYFSF